MKIAKNIVKKDNIKTKIKRNANNFIFQGEINGRIY